MTSRELFVGKTLWRHHDLEPFDPALLAPHGIPQYRFGDVEPGRTAGWTEIAI